MRACTAAASLGTEPAVQCFGASRSWPRQHPAACTRRPLPARLCAHHHLTRAPSVRVSRARKSTKSKEFTKKQARATRAERAHAETRAKMLEKKRNMLLQLELMEEQLMQFDQADQAEEGGAAGADVVSPGA